VLAVLRAITPWFPSQPFGFACDPLHHRVIALPQQQDTNSQRAASLFISGLLPVSWLLSFLGS